MIENGRHVVLRSPHSEISTSTPRVNLAHQHKRMSVPCFFKGDDGKKLPTTKRNRLSSITSSNTTASKCATDENSFYFAAADIDDDFYENIEFDNHVDTASSNSDSGVDNFFNVINCTPILTPQICEVRKCIGLSGGSLTLAGCNISLHIPSLFPRTKDALLLQSKAQQPGTGRLRAANFVKKYCMRSSLNVSTKERKITGFDGRIVLSQNTPPSMLNTNLQTTAGPLVRIDYIDSRIFQSGAVLQINLCLKLSTDEHLNNSIYNLSNKLCDFSCLISKSVDGPFHEIKPNYCCYYQNTAQISLYPDLTSTEINDRCKQLVFVPIVRYVASLPWQPDTIWREVSEVGIRIGIYGNQHLHDVTKCCISISRINITQPGILNTTDKYREDYLHLWCSFDIYLSNIQDLNLSIESNNFQVSANELVPPGFNLFIASTDLDKYCEVTKYFSLCRKGNKCTESFRRSYCYNYSKPLVGATHESKQRGKVNVTLVGSIDNTVHKLQVLTPDLAPNLRASSPIRRWNKLQSRPKTLYMGLRHKDESCNILFNTSHDENKLKPKFLLYEVDRQLTALSYIKTNARRDHCKKKQSPCLNRLACKRGEILQVISKQNICVNNGNDKKDYVLCIRNNLIGYIATKDCSPVSTASKLTIKFTVSHVVQEICDQIHGITHLLTDFSRINVCVVERLGGWDKFASVVGYHQNLIERIFGNKTQQFDIRQREFLLLYMKKYQEYCESDGVSSYLVELVKALLYMEEYDLTEDILLTIARTITSRAIARKLRDSQSCAGSNESRTMDTNVNTSTCNIYLKPTTSDSSGSRTTQQFNNILLSTTDDDTRQHICTLITVFLSIDVLKQYCTRL